MVKCVILKGRALTNFANHALDIPILMANQINNLQEAQAELAAVQESIARLLVFTQRLQGLLGGASSPKAGTGAAPDDGTMTGAVLMAFNMKGGGPITPKEVVQAIRESKLTGHEKSELYTSVFNTIQYLMNKNIPLVEKVGEGQYKLLPPKNDLDFG